MSNLRFSELGLSEEILKAVDKMGFEEASPIQTVAIPPILAGDDIVGLSSTGSGKTAAFAIPAVEKVDPKLRAVQVLVLCPTRELAVQVSEEMAKISSFKKGVHAFPIFGGQSYGRQFSALESGVQIIIGTPGRVLDHLERGSLRLDSLKMLVLDEADRMLDMGFREDIEQVLSQTAGEHQTLFFSATMPRQIEDLIRRFAKNPKRIKIEATAQNVPQVDQVFYEVDRRSKVEILTRVIDMNDFRYGIVFCSTKIMVDELEEHMTARGYLVERLHGDISQVQRTRVMEKFRRRGFEFLIATDVAARGLDVDDLEVVFNYDLPNDAEDYTHRIGRTGRAGRSGKAFTFVSGRELYKLQAMIRYGKINIRREKVPSLDLVEEARENQFFEKLRQTLDAGKFAKNERIIERLLEQGYESTDIIAALIHIIGGSSDAGPEDAKSAALAPEIDSENNFSKKQKLSKKSLPGKTDSGIAGNKKSSSEKNFDEKKSRHLKEKFDRPGRTGLEPGFATLYFNIGRKSLVTPADIVGKISGLAKVPASSVGAIDIHQRHSLVDVRDEVFAKVMSKLTGIRMKGEVLTVKIAEPE
ncbi:MAG: DEAD/DEAH box helicase [Puniceicoccales bacterium]|jgi:ATP-dependent RNA helicase DeaD|nr:DEAD/DEAH box helicase [Puniceicoccales bacterium]